MNKKYLAIVKRISTKCADMFTLALTTPKPVSVGMIHSEINAFVERIAWVTFVVPPSKKEYGYSAVIAGVLYCYHNSFILRLNNYINYTDWQEEYIRSNAAACGLTAVTYKVPKELSDPEAAGAIAMRIPFAVYLAYVLGEQL